MTVNENKQMLCLCHSGKTYTGCCKRFHDGQLPETALELMRSRYCAYARKLPEYIIHTTHPDNPQFNPDKATWTAQILSFCLHTEFQKLDILHFEEHLPFATVAFTAHLAQNQKNASFTERSLFEKIKGKWFYLSAEFQDE